MGLVFQTAQCPVGGEAKNTGPPSASTRPLATICTRRLPVLAVICKPVCDGTRASPKVVVGASALSCLFSTAPSPPARFQHHTVCPPEHLSPNRRVHCNSQPPTLQPTAHSLMYKWRSPIAPKSFTRKVFFASKASGHETTHDAHEPDRQPHIHAGPGRGPRPRLD